MYDAILVPTDGSVDAEVAVDHALALARAYDATVHALFVVDVADLGLWTSADVPAEKLESPLRDLGEEATASVVEQAEAAGVPAVAEIRVGLPHEEILDYVGEHEIDAIVMGTHGRTGLSRALLGSVTERVIRLSPVPVLTVREREDGGAE